VTSTSLSARRPHLLFYGAALAVVTACVVIARSRAFAANPDVAAWGITFDLTLSIPALYWFFVVRTGKARPLTLAPLFIAGTVLATALIPRPQQQFLHALETFVAPAVELFLIAALVVRIRAARREPARSNDPYERIAAAARGIVGEGIVATAIASEMAMFYYAFFCWRKHPEETKGTPFTVHERSGWGSIVVCIMVLIVAESAGMHLLLRIWSHTAAWIWLSMDVWAIVWLTGDYHALRLRRSSVDEDGLHIRYGMRWSVSVPLDLIESIEAVHEEKQWKQPGVLKMAILEEPRWRITLREPVTANGISGIRKTIRSIALLPDDDDAIEKLRAFVAVP
jgi:hypothetical protein